ncbi:putative NBD/HSP70 family sugar kinase/biotin operon repressor [Friedmanniella endophytica]|uniref:Putative NBD/HSP70 family sugar kinase/biotin operon repressor n=1 Tax=Microlunatus kandeliicorticis TaxID=1759536 RepID=A0A7W3IVD3_9ACTN|nr:ROK family transcriptional regulator [Microlunatus kandeliicorticis]MBA8795805.1 putative NBD/HSP70 family sugar kinase/biotin operon repressor [Microlunatus kandeliicorticis]
MTTPAERRRPSLGLLRNLTDAHVLDQLLEAGALTRADIAARTGISKPTISEAVRRLGESGVITEVGEADGRGRRGPAGTLYRLADGVGVAFVQYAGPEGVRTELLDLRGTVLAARDHPVPSPTTADRLGPVLVSEADAVLTGAPGPVLAATVSVANPVDRRTGRLVRLPDSPFLLDELVPAELLDDRLGVPVQVDNDVNWAALAEHRAGAATDLEDVVYCFLGPGLGLGLVLGGGLVRGHRGLAGELAYVITTGPDGRGRRLLESLGDHGLLREGSWAIDVEAMAALLGRRDAAADRVLAAVAGAIATIAALVDPEAVVIADHWSADADLADRLAGPVAAAAPVPVALRAAMITEHAPLVGARTEALAAAHRRLTARPAAASG